MPYDQKSDPTQGIAGPARFTTIIYPGQLMGKEFRLAHDGSVQGATDGHGWRGWFKVEEVGSLRALSAVLDAYDVSQIMVHGVPWLPDADEGYVHTGIPAPDMDLAAHYDIERTKECLADPDGLGLATFDSDFEGAPEWAAKIRTPEIMQRFLLHALPELEGVGMLVRPSGSNGILLPDGTPRKPTRNFHTHFFCKGRERAAILERLHDAFAVRGFGWIKISSSGALLDRTPVDLALRTPNQPVFSAPPRVVPPVRSERPAPLIVEGRPLRLEDLPKLSSARAVFRDLKAEQGLLLRQAQTKAAYVKQQARAALAMQSNPRKEQVKEEVQRQRRQSTLRDEAAKGSSLGPDFVLFLHPSRRAVTVRDVLTNPLAYHEAKTCDPIEPDYRGWAQTGKIYATGAVVRLVSLAHGLRTPYALKGDNASDDILPAVREAVARLLRADRKTQEVSPEEGEARLRREIDRFLKEFGKRVAIRGTQGIGKTTKLNQMLADMALPIKVLQLLPSHRNVREAFNIYTEAGGTDAIVRRGRMAPDPEAVPVEDDKGDLMQPLMCLRPEAVERHMKRHGPERSVDRYVCGKCLLKARCGYKEQERLIKEREPALIFATHDFAHINVGGGWEPGAVIVDEALRTGGLDDSTKTGNDGMLPLGMKGDAENWRAVLRKHRETMCSPTDDDALEAHRLRTEVLEALADESNEYGPEDVYFYMGEWVLVKGLEFLYRHLPLLVLDGTARRELIELWLGPLDDLIRIDVRRNLVVTQVTGHSFSNESICKTNANRSIKEPLQKVIEEYVQTGASFISTKKVRAHMGKAQDPNWMHFGDVRGRNDFAARDVVVVIGQLTLPPPIVEAQAKALCRKHGLPLPSGKQVRVSKTLHTEDGKSFDVEYWDHEDPIVSALMHNKREDEVAQACDRVRATRHAGQPKEVLILGTLDLDYPVHKVVEWRHFKVGHRMSRIQLALDRGPLPHNPKQWHRMHPDLWGSDRAGRLDDERESDWRDGLIEDRARPEGFGQTIKVWRRP